MRLRRGIGRGGRIGGGCRGNWWGCRRRWLCHKRRGRGRSARNLRTDAGLPDQDGSRLRERAARRSLVPCQKLLRSIGPVGGCFNPRFGGAGQGRRAHRNGRFRIARHGNSLLSRQGRDPSVWVRIAHIFGGRCRSLCRSNPLLRREACRNQRHRRTLWPNPNQGRRAGRRCPGLVLSASLILSGSLVVPVFGIQSSRLCCRNGQGRSDGIALGTRCPGSFDSASESWRRSLRRSGDYFGWRSSGGSARDDCGKCRRDDNAGASWFHLDVGAGLCARPRAGLSGRHRPVTTRCSLSTRSVRA